MQPLPPAIPLPLECAKRRANFFWTCHTEYKNRCIQFLKYLFHFPKNASSAIPTAQITKTDCSGKFLTNPARTTALHSMGNYFALLCSFRMASPSAQQERGRFTRNQRKKNSGTIRLCVRIVPVRIRTGRSGQVAPDQGNALGQGSGRFLKRLHFLGKWFE